MVDSELADTAEGVPKGSGGDYRALSIERQSNLMAINENRLCKEGLKFVTNTFVSFN
jgi:hypothetical protein